MNRLSSIVSLLVVPALILFSCQKENELGKENDRIDTVSFSIEDYKIGDEDEIDLTRTSFIDQTTGGSFVWAANDTVGIYPANGSQIYFSIEGSGGENYADFDGGGWAFKTSAKYYSYYPFIGDIYLDRHKIPVSYVGQKQIGISTTDHIGPFDYMYTPACSSNGGKLNFMYRHLSCIIRLNMTLPVGNYTKLAITAPSKAFVKTGWYDLQSDSPSINSKETSNQLVIDLENVNVTVPSTQAYVYVLSSPVNLNGKEITVSILNDKRQELQCKKTISREYLAATKYSLKCTVWTEVPQSMGMIIDGWGDGGNIGGDAE